MKVDSESGPALDALLLQPPPGDLTGPYPALPYLKAAAEQRGYTVRTRDLAIEALLFLTSDQQLGRLFKRAQWLRQRLETKRRPTHDEHHHYAALASVAALGSNPRFISEALQVFRDKERFYEPQSYRQACRGLDAFFLLLSAIHYPTQVTPSDYPSAQTLGSVEAIIKHQDRSLNPYMEYYDRKLFLEIEREKPAVIGISMEFASQSVQALVLGSLIKKRFPEIHVTMGGAYLSQWVLLMGGVQFDWLFRCTDSVVCGEGENSFTQLMGAVLDKLPFSRVTNLISVDRDTGELHRFQELEYPNIAELPPPDYSDFDLEAYLIPKPVIPYVISRGCYWGKCVFCQNRYGEKSMRRYQTVPIEKALAEMTDLAEQHGANHFNFSNDVVDPPYLKRFSEAVIAAGKSFVWNTDLRAEKAFTKDLCRTMAKAGLNCVAIGFESACQRTLDRMNKGKKVEVVRRVMKDLYDAGVAVQAMGFFGFPDEEAYEAETTVRFLEENQDRISYYVIGLLMVVPGSLMHEEPGRFGVDSVSYEGNVLMTPQPVWRCASRISSETVNLLYSRLSTLEETYTINEYPYVGALSTNHGFLYFRLGPDILKRIREDWINSSGK